jgi:hypothetical protein
MKLNLVILSLLSILIVSPTSFAGHHDGGGGCAMSWDMNAMDTNQDGLLTFDEYSGGKGEKMRKGFDMVDMDNNEVIDQDEWNHLLEAHGVTVN